MARNFLYQAKTEPLPVPVVAVASFLTVVQFTGLFQYQVKAEPVLVPPAPAVDVLNPTTTTSEVTFPRSIIYQSIAYTPVVEAAPTADIFVPLAVDVSVSFKRQWQYQIKSEALLVPPESVNVNWHSPWTTPTVTKRRIYDQGILSPPFQPPAATVPDYAWHQGWSQPVRIKPKIVFQQSLAWSGYTPAAAPVVTAIEPTTLTSQVTFPRSIQYQSKAWTPQTIGAEVITEDKWHQAWSQPVRVRPKVVFQQTLAWSGYTPAITPPTFTYFNMVEGDTGLSFQKTIIYQESAQAESPETHVFWHQPWSEPVRQKPGLRTYLQQEPAWSTFTPAAAPVVTAVEPTTITSHVIFRRSIPYQALAWCPQTITPPTLTYFNMVEGDTGLIFRKSIIYQVNTQPVQVDTVVPPTPTPEVEPTTITSSVIFRRSIPYQSLAWCPRTIVPETITEDKWHQPWSQPVRTRRLATAQQRAYFGPEATIPTPPAITAVEPTTITSSVIFRRSILYQSLAWCPQTITPPSFVFFNMTEGDTGLLFQKTIIYQESAQAESPETHVFWYAPWSEPVRQKAGLKTHLQQEPAWSTYTPAFVPPVVTAVEPTTATSSVIFRRSILYQSIAWPLPLPAEIITEDKWHQAWSQPVRVRTLATAQQQALVWSGYTPQPEIITEDKWHQAWSEPVRLKKGLRADQQQFIAFNLQPPIVSIGFYGWLSEPVRLKKGLRTDLQQAFTTAPADPNLLRIIPWYAPLTEPVRQKKGLWARLQQFFTTDPNKPPQPPVFVILDAHDTNNDVAQIFAVVYNPPVRCYVSIKEVPGSDPTYASIEETN